MTDLRSDESADAGAAASAPPAWYWVAAVAALLWEAMGCLAYLTQVSMGPAELAALPEAQRNLWLSMPVWVTGAYAVAVWVGLAGAAALLLRRRWARAAFLVSLAAVIVQFGWTFLATDILRTMPASQSLPLPVAIIGVAALLAWFAAKAARRGWLR